MACITLITDFGTRDHYVGVMKGVMHTLAPEISVIDVTHEISPQNILHAAVVLRQVWPWFPQGTVHLAVVDPGVGSKRRILLGRYGGQYVIAPDNGLLSVVHRELPIEELRVIENLRLCLPLISNTFHGRDIMAPVAARLASGQNPPRDFGPVTDRLEVLQIAAPTLDPARGIVGSVLYADRFGNLITNVRAQDLQRLRRGSNELYVYFNDRHLGPLSARYTDVPAGDPVALIGSGDHLEIAVNQGSAAEILGDPREARIEIRPIGVEEDSR